MRRLLCILLAMLFLPLLTACDRTEPSALCVTVLDVGQSDCILISKADRYMLIDTGTANERDAVLSQLAQLSVKELAYLVVTHPHEDHYGNARVLLETYPVDTLVITGAPGDELGYQMMLEVAAAEGTSVKTVTSDWSFALGEAACTAVCAMPQAEHLNNASLVVRVAFGKTAFLFMGDTEKEGEQALIASHGAGFLRCDVIKVGHHGSDTASTAELLALAAPRFAAISCGEGNDYGFPHAEVLARLETAGAFVCRTDTMGALRFVSDGKEVAYEE